MGPHTKTILTILGGLTLLASLIAFPTFAKCVWIGLWIFVTCLVAALIYEAIYLCFETHAEDVRKLKERREQPDMASFDPVI